MITDEDIKKLATVFVTKDDLLAMERRMDEKYASKEVQFELERRMNAVENKVEDLQLAFSDLKSEIQGSTDAIIREFIKAFEKAEASREKVDLHENQIKHIKRTFQKIKLVID